MKNSKRFFLALIILLMIGIIYFDLSSKLNLSQLKNHIETVTILYNKQPLFILSMFMLICTFFTAISFPSGMIFALSSGAIFGTIIGTIVIIISGTIGSALAFLSSRYLFRESLEIYFKKSLKQLNEGLDRNVWNYLLFLRLVPIFPFFIVNLALGLTRVPLKLYVLSTFLGMTPVTIVITNAGRQLASIDSMKDILSIDSLITVSLLGVCIIIPAIYKRRGR